MVMFFLFAGMFLIMAGIYEEKLKEAENKTRVEYRFIPRTYYEEQLADSDLSMKVADMFNRESPWFDRTVGSLADIPSRNNDPTKAAA